MRDPASIIEAIRAARSARSGAVVAGLFDRQMAVVNDTSRRIAIHPGRRSGKTTLLPRIILRAMERNPARGELNPVVGFLARTQGQARRLIWGRLQQIVARLNLPVTFNSSTHEAAHANGCQFWILGADKEADVDKMRGHPFALLVVDEAQTMPLRHFEYLVREVIAPALMDLDGQLVLSGTPPASRRGFFREACEGRFRERFSVHHWTVLENPMFPRWAGRPDWRKVAPSILAQVLADEGLTEDDPIAIREWQGRFVRDDSGLVYRYDEQRNAYDGTLPKGHRWRYVLGVDLGYDDAFATVVWAFTEDLPDLWEVDEFSVSGWVPSRWAEHITALVGEWDPERIVVDSGGLGRAIVEEFKQRYGIACESAEKTAKNDYIELMNADYARGRIHLLADGELAEEVTMLQWEPIESTVRNDPKYQKRRREDPSFSNHLADAHLYAWREAQHWAHQPKEESPEAGTDEYWKAEEAAIWKRVENEGNPKTPWWDR